MKIIVTEKPNITKAIIDSGIIKGVTYNNGITQGNIDGEMTMILTASGHLLSLKSAWELLGISKEEYSQRYSETKQNYLFDSNVDYQNLLKVNNDKLKAMKAVLKNENVNNIEFICATDPDEEGAQIYYSIVKFLGADPDSNKSFNMDTGSLDISAISQAWKDRSLFKERTSQATRARARALFDATTGWNYTYALGSQIGRVKGAILAVVGDIEDKRVNHKEIKTYKVELKINEHTFLNNYEFKTKEGAENFAKDVESGKINFAPSTKDSKKEKKVPTFHDDISLNQAIGAKLRTTLADSANSLRLNHRLISYLRNGGIKLVKKDTAKTLESNLGSFAPYLKEQGINLKEIHGVPSKSITNKTIKHEGIHVTGKNGKVPSTLTNDEKIVFNEILTRNLATMSTPVLYTEHLTTLKPSVENEEAAGYKKIERTIQDEGYLYIYPSDMLASVVDKKSEITDTSNITTNIREVITKPKSHYDFIKLEAKMANIGSDIEDPEVKKIYKDVKGIGTSATLQSTIVDMIKKGYFEVKEFKENKENRIITYTVKGAIKPTPKAMDLFYYLRDNKIPLINLKDSAQMEMNLNKVQDGEMEFKTFMDLVNKGVTLNTDIIKKHPRNKGGKGNNSQKLTALKSKCPKCGKEIGYLEIKGHQIIKCTACDFAVFAQVKDKKIPKSKLEDFINFKQIPMKGLKNKEGKSFDTNIVLKYDKASGEKPKIEFVFDKRSNDEIYENKNKTGFMYHGIFIGKKQNYGKIIIDMAQAKELYDNGMIIVDGVTLTKVGEKELSAGGLKVLEAVAK